MRARSMITAAALLGTTAVGAAEPKTFRDWMVACDNLRNCAAFAVGQDWVGAYVKISRDAGPAAAPVVSIFADVQKGTRLTLGFDDPALSGLPRGAVTPDPTDGETARIAINGPDVETFLASLRKATKLSVRRTDAPGAPKSDPPVSEVSMAGATAAMLYMDEQQGRLGTTTALIRRGDKPASAVPAPSPAPTVIAARSGTGAVPAKPPAAVLAKAKGLCGKDGGKAEPTDINRLNDNLVLYWFSCRELSGAYNHASTLLVAPADKPEAARRPIFQAPAEIPARDTGRPEMLVNADFDEGTMTINTFTKGRGVGDCGTTAEWVWTGREFALLQYTAMPTCAGVFVEEWPVLYRASRK